MTRQCRSIRVSDLAVLDQARPGPTARAAIPDECWTSKPGARGALRRFTPGP